MSKNRAPLQVLVFLFHRNDNIIEYCLFKRADLKVWQGISGGVKLDEKLTAAAQREIKEETGIMSGNLISLTSQFSIPSIMVKKDFLDRGILIVEEHSFGLEVFSKEITLSNEHSEYKWLEYKKAFNCLHWDSNRTALWELNYRIQNNLMK